MLLSDEEVESGRRLRLCLPEDSVQQVKVSTPRNLHG